MGAVEQDLPEFFIVILARAATHKPKAETSEEDSAE